MLIILLLIQFTQAATLNYLIAGHDRSDEESYKERKAHYSLAVKSNSVSVSIFELLLMGKIKKEYSLIDIHEMQSLSPYIVKDCLKEDHNYLFAGDLYNNKGYYFEGLVIGVPKNYQIYSKIYLCSIVKNHGREPSGKQPDLGEFLLGYALVEDLQLIFADNKRLNSKLYELKND